MHACAVQTDTNPDLSLQEFSDLLFNNEESFQANLKAIPATDINHEAQLRETLQQSMGNRTIDLASLTPENMEKLRLRNKWRQVIQNNL